jgi:hypothetical protein
MITFYLRNQLFNGKKTLLQAHQAYQIFSTISLEEMKEKIKNETNPEK